VTTLGVLSAIATQHHIHGSGRVTTISTSSSLIPWLTGAGVAAAAVGAWYSGVQARIIAKDVKRRARFRLAVTLESPTQIRQERRQPADQFDNVFVVTRPAGEPLEGVLRIQFKNTGTRRAEHTLLNINAPMYLDDFYFSNQQGEETLKPTVTTSGKLKDLDDQETPAFFLDRVFAAISRRHDYLYFVHFCARNAHPQSIPFYVILDSDDLPDDSPTGEERHVWVKIEEDDQQASPSGNS
jgi:hypothetical protein